MIRKVIHYCWFGKNPKPRLVNKCIKSWEKNCRGYRIIEWNEKNFDIPNAPLYVRQAYQKKKWAFVTDYVRLYVLFKYGGIYMDTDVEVIKPLGSFMSLHGFSGFEREGYVPTGIMAAEKGHILIYELLKEYEKKRFIKNDGSLNLETNVIAITRYMKKKGLKLDNSLQTISKYTFYPKDYFCPKSYHDGKIYKTGNTHTIHHFAGSWKTKSEKKEHKKEIRRKKYEKQFARVKVISKLFLGEKMYAKLAGIFTK